MNCALIRNIRNKCLAAQSGLRDRRAAVEREYQKHTHIRGNLGARRAARVKGLESEIDELDAMIAKLSSPVVFVLSSDPVCVSPTDRGRGRAAH